MTPSVAWELVRSGHLVRSLRLAPFVTSAAAVAAFLVARRGGTHDVIGRPARAGPAAGAG